MIKEFGIFGKRGVAGVQVFLMIFSLIAFCYMISFDVVRGDWYSDLPSLEEANALIDSGKKKVSSSNIPSSGRQLSSSDQESYNELLEQLKQNSETGAATTTSTADQSFIAQKLGTTAGSGWSALLSGLQWAAVAYGIGQLVGPIFGLEEDNVDALSWSLAAGAGIYEGFGSAYGTGGEGLWGMGSDFFASGGSNAIFGSLGWGIIVAAIIFAIMYKDTETKEVTFSCLPWQAPNGGEDCELCNDPDFPCSEYRCKSLGATCEIVNQGTTNEMCVNVNPMDTNPPVILPNKDMLTSGYEYTNVKTFPSPSPGFNIISNSRDGCLKAFSPLEFGISIDGEPAQCKIDFNHTESFDDMVSYIGGSNLYAYNHSERLSLPSPGDFQNSSIVLRNGDEMTLFIRCQDRNGNANENEYAVNFCIDPSPDTTPPVIEATSVLNGGCVAENTEKAEVKFYTNEPADCRWSHVNQDYDDMPEKMECKNKIYQVNAMQLYTCTSQLDGIAKDGSSFYIRCEDRATELGSNKMGESFVFNLRGSNGLLLRNLHPNGTITGGVSPMPVELYAETSYGCDNGRAICFYYDTRGQEWLRFGDTDNEDGINTQRLDLGEGSYSYDIKCIDSGGNLVEDSIDFTLNIDIDAPEIARIYEEGGMLKIVTLKNSRCSYTFDNCDFTFEEGTDMPYNNTPIHVTDWNNKKTYYIKCRDEFLNEEADCSVIVKPTDDFFSAV